VAHLLALASAVLYGAADFLGGVGARRVSALAVVLTSQAAGLLALLVLLQVVPAATPSARDLWWGALAGLGSGTGVALLYRALAIGTMAVVAPATAVCAVALPVLGGYVAGDRLSSLTLGGIALALVAIGLLGRHPAEARDLRRRLVPPGLWHALASGVAIGFFFLALARASSDAGLWPLVGARGSAVALFVGLGLLTGTSPRTVRPVLAIAMGAGVVDVSANAVYLIASWYAPLGVVVTLASLYPASTVLLARVLLGERLNRWQVLGVVCALAAILLIVGGDAASISPL
jgi:drug/metabolite transporter (DMT)-like permease